MLSTPSRSGMASRGAAVPYTAAASARTCGAGVGEGEGEEGRAMSRRQLVAQPGLLPAIPAVPWCAKQMRGQRATRGSGQPVAQA